MEKRIIEFVAGLRAAGARISIAESEDAFRAVQRTGMLNPDDFREALRATLIKKVQDEASFEQLFPVYFTGDTVRLADLLEKLSPEERQLVQQALQTLLAQLERQQNEPSSQYRLRQDPLHSRVEDVAEMLQWLLRGQMPHHDVFEQAEAQVLENIDRPPSSGRLQKLVLSRLGGELMSQVRYPLPNLLREKGMSQASVADLMKGLAANFETLNEQAAAHSKMNLASQWASQQAERTRQVNELMNRSLQQLSEREANLLRQEIRRLVARLRSQIALRQKRAKRGTLNVRQTLRTNMRYGGVPLELKFKTQAQKPRLLLLCDISNSMRHVVEFALRLVYELQDQVSSVRTFTYIDVLEEIGHIFAQFPPDVAMTHAAARLRPHHPNTDLGTCLATLLHTYPETIDQRTTVIIVGDACNSWNDPRVDLMAQLQTLSKEIIWLNPRERGLWEANDCDMNKYLPYARAVHHVSSLADLAVAVDKLLTS